MQLEEARQRARAAESSKVQLEPETDLLRSDLEASRELLRVHQERSQKDQTVMVSTCHVLLAAVDANCKKISPTRLAVKMLKIRKRVQSFLYTSVKYTHCAIRHDFSTLCLIECSCRAPKWSALRVNCEPRGKPMRAR